MGLHEALDFGATLPANAFVAATLLGSAAGGGFPQWNCNGPLSHRARAGDPKATMRTQSSIAVSAEVSVVSAPGRGAGAAR